MNLKEKRYWLGVVGATLALAGLATVIALAAGGSAVITIAAGALGAGIGLLWGLEGSD